MPTPLEEACKVFRPGSALTNKNFDGAPTAPCCRPGGSRLGFHPVFERPMAQATSPPARQTSDPTARSHGTGGKDARCGTHPPVPPRPTARQQAAMCRVRVQRQPELRVTTVNAATCTTPVTRRNTGGARGRPSMPPRARRPLEQSRPRQTPRVEVDAVARTPAAVGDRRGGCHRRPPWIPPWRPRRGDHRGCPKSRGNRPRRPKSPPPADQAPATTASRGTADKHGSGMGEGGSDLGHPGSGPSAGHPAGEAQRKCWRSGRARRVGRGEDVDATMT